MGEIQGPDEILMAICAEAPGWFEIDPESGEPMETCAYSKLMQLGYSSQSLARADGKDGKSINYLSQLGYQEAGASTVYPEMQIKTIDLGREQRHKRRSKTRTSYLTSAENRRRRTKN